MGEDLGEDLKASINTTTKLFRNFSHAKSSTLSPSSIAARHHLPGEFAASPEALPLRDALTAAGNEAEICVESLEEHVQSAETEKAPFDESNRGDAVVDLYDDNDKLIGQPEIISVNNCNQEEQGFRMEEWRDRRRQMLKDSTTESRGNEPTKQRKMVKQQLVHPYLRHLKVKNKKLKQLKLPHYEQDLRLTENRDLSLTYQDSHLLSNNETNEMSSPLSPCMLQSANKNSPTMIRDKETP